MTGRGKWNEVGLRSHRSHRSIVVYWRRWFRFLLHGRCATDILDWNRVCGGHIGLRHNRLWIHEGKSSCERTTILWRRTDRFTSAIIPDHTDVAAFLLCTSNLTRNEFVLLSEMWFANGRRFFLQVLRDEDRLRGIGKNPYLLARG
jgi:hypothetical protein